MSEVLKEVPTEIPTEALGLYIHIPWCLQKCPYCDFNSHALKGELPEQQYLQTLLRDLDHAFAGLGRAAQTVFIGGGTPSLLHAETVAQLLEYGFAKTYIDPQAEITLEANPGTFEQQRFAAYRRAGVNRLSIGVQSFAPKALQRLGRVHGREAALRAGDIAREAGFDRVNMDLMYALPEQSLDAALEDLRTALALGATHISWYQLTLEPQTPFYHRPPVLPDEDTVSVMQDAGYAILAEAGLRRYEVSAFAVAGQECHHNLGYWRYQAYIGVGAGAHGMLRFKDQHGNRVERYTRRQQPAKYMQEVAAGQPVASHHTVPYIEQIFESMFNGLRLLQGVSRQHLEQLGIAWEDIQPGWQRGIALGLLENCADKVVCSARGMELLSDTQALFLPPESTSASSTLNCGIQ